MQGFETKDRQLLLDVLNVSLEKPFQAEKGLKSPTLLRAKCTYSEIPIRVASSVVQFSTSEETRYICILQSLHIFINFLVFFGGNSHFNEVNAKLINHCSKSLCIAMKILKVARSSSERKWRGGPYILFYLNEPWLVS